jgi:hypothetical protein
MPALPACLRSLPPSRFEAMVFGGMLLAAAPDLAAQSADWRPVAGPSSRMAMTFDVARGRMLGFGGGTERAGVGVTLDETWEWDGSAWLERTPASSPPPRRDASLAYDLARGRAVLFGGAASGGPLFDTWEWDGSAWHDRTPAVGPRPSVGQALAYDWTRSRTVCVGATSSTTIETWEWDGSSWTQRPTPNAPPWRSTISIAYDVIRNRTVLFGGLGNFGALGDTWEWDGNTWIARVPAVSPPPRYGHRLAYDFARARTVLYHGWSPPSAGLTDVWEWDGVTWTHSVPLLAPPSAEDVATACDLNGRMVAFSSIHYAEMGSQTWHWDGATWSLRNEMPEPNGRTAFGLAHDPARQRTVLFGGRGTAIHMGETLEFDGFAWRRMQPALSPSPREGPALAHDGVRARTLLFGGYDNSGPCRDTWEWDGAVWTARAPATLPPARSNHMLVTDTTRNRIVMFGGNVASFGPLLADTWEWDGNDWTQRQPAASPPARSNAGIAFDAQRGRTVMFGGYATIITALGLADTWEWDGTNWSRVVTANNPGVRAVAAMAWHPGLGRTVLFSGWTPSGPPVADTWEFDGVDWRPATPAHQPMAQFGAGLVAVPERNGMLFLSGHTASIETWDYRATCSVLGGGCPGSSGVPVLEATSLLRVGGAFTVTLSNLPPSSVAAAIAGGLSTTAWALGALPAQLAPFGLTGCTLYVSPDVLTFLPAVAGRSSMTVQVPTNAALVGLAFHQQGLALEPGVNPAGAIVSNAISMVVGP